MKVIWEKIIVILSAISILLYFFLWLTYPKPIFGFFSPDIPLLFIILVGGFPLTVQIILKMIKGDWGADILAALAIITAVFTEEYLAANFIILMIAGGHILESYAIRKASSALEALSKRMPSIAHRKINDHIEEIDTSEIKLDDAIVIYPNEISPVDGNVISGHGFMDESYISGEPYVIPKAPGASVLSGAINGQSLLIIKATKLVKDSRYAKIMRIMEESSQHKPRLRRLADQLGALFAPFALIIAGLTWYFTGDVIRFLAVLVIATPCPLIIAIPITLISAISQSAKQSIIIRDPTVLERLPTCKTAIFDKTGTLTYGKPELNKISPAQDIHPDKLLQYAASVERYSKHPLSKAIIDAAKKSNLILLDAQEISEKPGVGLTAMIEGQSLLITSRHYIEKNYVSELDKLPLQQQGLECIIVLNNTLMGVLNFRDTPRTDSALFIKHLGPSHHFEKIILLSGDRASEVEYLASLLEIENTYASQSPEQKVDVVKRETKKAPTLFMGDGLNDAPGLTAATVGIAFGQQNEVTSEAAGAVILENSLEKVDELLHISERMRRIALQSGVGGILLSVIGIGFAALGFITPVAGAIIQEVIDVLAIANALRLTWEPKVDTDMKATSG